MEKNILTVNIGSSSKKYSLWRSKELIFSAHFEKNAEGFLVSYLKSADVEISELDFESSLAVVLEKIKTLNLINSEFDLSGVGFRIVAPGTYFTENHLVDSEFIQTLRTVKSMDNVHVTPMIEELEKIQHLLPNIKIVAVSDSAFHKNIPTMARNYSINSDLAEKLDLYRFGYHGISLSSVVVNPVLSGVNNGRLIVCHLGSGVSITAIKNGLSADTSMGYLPLNGPTMSSRVGDIDPGAVLALQSAGLDVFDIFYKKSGLLGISELSSDMRVLLNAEKERDSKAGLAVDTFVYSIIKYIGSYATVLGGVDAIVFCGTIGERSSIIREKICSKLSFVGVKLDSSKNDNTALNMKISSDSSSVSVFVVHSDEAKAILADTEAML